MAIIRSLAIGKGRKSAGNLTFRTVKGRTIVSEKVGKRDTSTRAGLSLREFMFGLVTRFAAERAADINVSFEKTEYGTARNMFIKVNYAHLAKAFESLYIVGGEVWEVTSQAMTDAVAAYVAENPQSIIRTKIGSVVAYLEGAWEPNTPAEISAVVSAKVGTTAMRDGIVFTTSNGTLAAGTQLQMSVTPDITSVSGAFLEVLPEGQQNVTVIQLNDVSLNGDVVSGTTASAVAKGKYTSWRFCVQSPVAIGELASKIYRTIELKEAGDDGNNPL